MNWQAKVLQQLLLHRVTVASDEKEEKEEEDITCICHLDDLCSLPNQSSPAIEPDQSIVFSVSCTVLCN